MTSTELQTGHQKVFESQSNNKVRKVQGFSKFLSSTEITLKKEKKDRTQIQIVFGSIVADIKGFATD